MPYIAKPYAGIQIPSGITPFTSHNRNIAKSYQEFRID